MARCQCIVVTSDGEHTRCQQDTYYPEDKFCYHHRKYFEIDGYFPSPDDWSRFKMEGQDYIVQVRDLDGDEVRTFDYRLTNPATMW